jgi:hypothetical protein
MFRADAQTYKAQRNMKILIDRFYKFFNMFMIHNFPRDCSKIPKPFSGYVVHCERTERERERTGIMSLQVAFRNFGGN